MSNTRCCNSLDDLLVEILTQIIVLLGLESAKDIISTRICSKKMYSTGEESEVFKEASLEMFQGMGRKDLKADVFIHKCAAHKYPDVMSRQRAEECFCNDNFDFGMSLLGETADEHRLEAIYLLGMIRISRGPSESDGGMNSMYIAIYI
uniref:At2g35280-like TPR domain-containing protein n=1 Tax=Lactuca sativa TaxID=4236 RepID=A0A9R1UHR7_LACSA|nr:hypothetical protein LSAT_V11C900489720 [Lactuca sativa]